VKSVVNNTKNHNPKTTILLSLTYDPDKLFSKFRIKGKTHTSSTGRKTNIVYYLPRTKIEDETMLIFAGRKIDGWLWRIIPRIMQNADGKHSCLEIVNEIGNSLGFSESPTIISRAIKKNLRSLIQSGILMLSEELSEKAI